MNDLRDQILAYLTRPGPFGGLIKGAGTNDLAQQFGVTEAEILHVVPDLKQKGFIKEKSGYGDDKLDIELIHEVHIERDVFIAKGGFAAEDAAAAEKKRHEIERQQLSDEKLKYDVKNAKRIFKTYWWTFGISIAAFLLSLYNFLYNLFVKR